MATIAVQYGSAAGAAISFTTVAAGGDTFNGQGHPEVLMRNNHATLARTFTFAVQKTVAGGLAITNRAVVVAALTIARIKLEPAYFLTSEGMITVTYSDSGADLQIAVLG